MNVHKDNQVPKPDLLLYIERLPRFSIVPQLQQPTCQIPAILLPHLSITEKIGNANLRAESANLSHQAHARQTTA